MRHFEERGACRIEQRWRPEENGEHHWVVYQRVNVIDRKHPVIRNGSGEPMETTATAVWVPVFSGVENEARMKFDALQQQERANNG